MINQNKQKSVATALVSAAAAIITAGAIGHNAVEGALQKSAAAIQKSEKDTETSRYRNTIANYRMRNADGAANNQAITTLSDFQECQLALSMALGYLKAPTNDKDEQAYKEKLKKDFSKGGCPEPFQPKMGIGSFRSAARNFSYDLT